MADKSSVKVLFLGDASSLTKAAKRAEGSIDNVGKKARGGSMSIGGLGKKFVGVAAAIGAVSMFKSFISEAEESRKVGRLTAQVIKSTGGAAKVTAAQVGNLATAISNKTGIDDEAIQSASNLLLTFTNVRNEVGKGNDVFNRATQAATDMAVALGTDPKQAALQLGKALNDPIKGISALSRSGVSFTEQQKKQITTLVKSGKTLQAQKIILGELGHEFGGAAAAASTPSQKLAVTVGNLKEQIGTALLPVVDKFATFLSSKLIPFISQGVTWLSARLGPAFRAVGEWVQKNLLPPLRSLGGWLKDKLLPAFKDAAEKILPKVRGAFHSVGETIKSHQPTFQKIGNLLRALGVVITELVIPVLGKVVGVIVSIVGPAFKVWVTLIGKVVIPAIRFMATVFLTVAGTIVNAAAKALGWVPGLGGKLKKAAEAFNKFRDDVNKALSGIRDKQVKITVVAGHKVNLNSSAGQQRFARGTNSARPGLAVVGEQGPELVEMQGGERVHTATATRRMLSAGSAAGGADRPVVVQLVLDGKVIQEALLRRKRTLGGGLGLA